MTQSGFGACAEAFLADRGRRMRRSGFDPLGAGLPASCVGADGASGPGKVGSLPARAARWSGRGGAEPSPGARKTFGPGRAAARSGPRLLRAEKLSALRESTPPASASWCFGTELRPQASVFCLRKGIARKGCWPRRGRAVIPGGADQWGSLAEGKTSSQLVDVLLEEIATGALRERNGFPAWEEEGSAEAFVAKPRSQDVGEKQEYLSQLKNKLGDLLEGKADDLKTAFCAIDPGIDDQTLDTYIDLPDQEDVPVETALERLLAGYARRVGPSPREGSTTGFGGEEGDFQ
ncbi:translin-associated factor X-interacting protein 1 isoform X2 [Falco rusticolus]|uniref:translin-associated factor X-interacting protein 1 isoform X2 n=1 Tax=Falco rusticolus TaxID=120794 RepID=UPI0018865A3B|nr:translin-associated factor X-interacting protein 1 isoform X2 [Falco rusticolus]